MVKLSYQRSFASHEKAKYWSDKNLVKPCDIYLNARGKYWFKCNDCKHDFYSAIHLVTKNNWCPYCSVPSRLLCTDNDCLICFNKSFASHFLSKDLSSKNNINPRYIFKHSNSKYIFNCSICNHEYTRCINKITDNTTSCPYCVKPSKILCSDNNCLTCFNKSFASHKIVKNWSNTNTEIPRNVLKCSIKKYIFECDVCNHLFEKVPNSITRNNKLGCPYCSKSGQILCNDDKCNLCFSKSFASHEKAKYWSDKNVDKPRYVAKCSNKKYLFNCNTCTNEFSSSLNNVYQGKWCVLCKNKTEKKLYNWLLKNYSDIIYQPKYEWCCNNTKLKLPYDFEVNNNIIIEIDGDQHYIQVSNWKSPEIQQERDLYKTECALNHNKHIIRIYQDDIWRDKNDWENKLKICISELKNISNPTLKLIGINEKYKNNIWSIVE